MERRRRSMAVQPHHPTALLGAMDAKALRRGRESANGSKFTSNLQSVDPYWSAVPIPKLNRFVVWLVFVWMGIVGNPNITRRAFNGGHRDERAPIQQIIDVFSDSSVNWKTSQRRENIAVRVGWKTVEPEAEIAIIAAFNDEAIESIRRVMLFNNFHSWLL